MARQKPETEPTGENPDPPSAAAVEPAEQRKKLKPGYVRLSLVVRESTSVRLYALAVKWKMSKTAAAERLLHSAMRKHTSDKKLSLAFTDLPSEDSEAA